MNFTLSEPALDALISLANRTGKSHSACVEDAIFLADAADQGDEPAFEPGDWYTTEQVCSLLNCSREYVRQLRVSGVLPYMMRAGKFFHPVGAVQALAKKHQP